MFEILSTIGLSASAAIVIGFLAYAMAENPPGRLTVAGVLTAWFALVVTIGASAALDPIRGFGVPALGLTVGLPVAALVSAFFAFGPIRVAMLAAPFPALVAVNAIRILPGWLFVLLYAAGKLPAPFAPSAGWGDIFAGVAALPLAWSIIRFGRRVAPLVFAWSVIGIADLVNAIALGALGALSAPGPLQTFAGPPTSAIMTTLPWLIVPGFLVPTLIFIHVVIVYRLLAKTEVSFTAHRWVGAGATKPT
jgi:hypothetical protein